jgi:hypothetical protein
MGRCTVHFIAQRAIGPAVNIYVREGMVAIPFHLHVELYVLMDIVQEVKEVTQSMGSVRPDHESVIHVREPA